MEREENAEECWVSLRLGRSVAPLLHYFALPFHRSYATFLLSVSRRRNINFIAREMRVKREGFNAPEIAV